MPDRPVRPRPGARFAVLLNQLFETRSSPAGHPYTTREVSDATGLPYAYLSLLRNGGIAHPPASRVQSLADFFGVDVRYFTAHEQYAPTDHTPTETDDIDTALKLALSDPLVQQMVLRAADFDDAEKVVLLRMIENVRDLRNLGRAQAAETPERTSELTDQPPSPPETSA